MKVLWVGDAVINSGFSVVTHNICNYLSQKCELEVFGVGYSGRVRHPCPFPIYPGLYNGDIYSIEYAMDIIGKTEPDVVVFFNDLDVIHRYLDGINNIRKLKELKTVTTILTPLNFFPAPTNDVLSLSFKDVDAVMTYTNVSKDNFKAINPALDVSAVYHGVDRKTYYKVFDVKKEFGLNNMFVVGNVNSNTYRKRLDLFLKGFAKFAIDKRDVRCLIHASGRDSVYNLKSISNDLGISNKVILSHSNLPVENMNALYNLMDVNVNTSMGEGFGLSLLEGASCAVPVLCANHANLKDIWGDAGTYIELKDTEYIAGTPFIGGLIDVDDMADKLTSLYEDRSLLSEMSNKIFEHANQERFSWDIIADKVYATLLASTKTRISYIA